MKFSSHKKSFMILFLGIVLVAIIVIRLEPGVKKNFTLSELFSVESYLKSIEKNNKMTIGVNSEQGFQEMTELIKDLELVDYDVRMIYPKEFQELPYVHKLNRVEQKEYEVMRFELLSRQVKEGIIDILYGVDLEDLEKLYEKGDIVSLKQQINFLSQNPFIHKGAYQYFENVSNGDFYFISPTFSVENYVLINQNYYPLAIDKNFLAFHELREIHDKIANQFESKGMTTFTFGTVLDDWDHIHFAFTKLIQTMDIPLVENGVLFQDERWKSVLEDFFSIVRQNRYLYGTVGTGLGADWAYSQGVIGMKLSALYDLHDFFNEHTLVAANNINIQSFSSSLCLYAAHSDFADYLDITSDRLAFSVNLPKDRMDTLLQQLFSDEFALSLLNRSAKKGRYPYFSNGGSLPIPCLLTDEVKNQYLKKLNQDHVEGLSILFDGTKVKKVRDSKEDVEILNILFQTELKPCLDNSVEIEQWISNMRKKYLELKK